MKPFWQYWVETIFWAIIAIIALFLALSLITWLVETIGGLAVLLLGLFVAGTYAIAYIWAVFDTNTKHMTPWFYKDKE